MQLMLLYNIDIVSIQLIIMPLSLCQSNPYITFVSQNADPNVVTQNALYGVFLSSCMVPQKSILNRLAAPSRRFAGQAKTLKTCSLTKTW